ncbi:MAG: formylglycine-generating enzyme family protein, partial [Xanthomonadaceae bacterium]|nr:formylglycine-generating enzyme family protein [Xanthomonadaceae bacterium]
MRGFARCGAWRSAASALCWMLALCSMLALAACRDPAPASARAPKAQATVAAADGARVIVSGDDAIAASLTWRSPSVTLPAAVDDTDRAARAAMARDLAALRRRAAAALSQDRLYEDADAAIPIYLALVARDPSDAVAEKGLQRAFERLIALGAAALAEADAEAQALQKARAIAAVVRTVGTGEREAAGLAYLGRVDVADAMWDINEAAERELAAGRLGEGAPGRSSQDGALPRFRQALALMPGQARATQGLAAVESALLRRAEASAQRGDFVDAELWLQYAANVRPGFDTVRVGRERVEAVRRAKIAALHADGMRLLERPNMPNHLKRARERLADLLLISTPGDPLAAALRAKIDLATHYGLLRPGQRFEDALQGVGRGPRMIVVPHGGFRMGARKNEIDGSDAERPQRYVRFDRGFAMSLTEITVGQFARFVASSGYRPRAVRRGHSLVYDPRGGNFVHRSGVDWRHDYVGRPAADSMPVLHITAKDAEAYARWLSERSGQRYRLPSEAEFEYATRAGSTSSFSWGDGAPPPNAANVTGARDVAPEGRRWGNAFAGYGDGHWGPAPVASFRPNAFGLYDIDGNVSEWVADCWHDGYRRAPTQGEAWINPGCRVRVVRGGAWANSPAQTRSAWRIHADADVTNAKT